MKRKLLPIVLGSLFLGLLFDLLFYGKVPGISFFIFVVFILLTTFSLASVYKKVLPPVFFILAGTSLFFSGMLAVRANELLSFLNFVATIFLLSLAVMLVVGPKPKLRDYTFRDYFKPTYWLPFETMGQFMGFIERLMVKDKETAKKSAQPIIRGVLLSLPFLFIFLLLFSSADLVFKKYIGSIFDVKISPELISHSLLILFAASLFTGLYALLLMPKARPSEQLSYTKISMSLGKTESTIILGSVGTLFAIFVIIQLAYLFGGEGHVTSTGITYAEYARKGFFELIAVAVIALALMLGIYSSMKESSRSLGYKLLNGLLVAEVMVIMLSAARRLGLYEQTYGFTSLRLYSHLFIGWLVAIFILLAIHVFKSQTQNKFTFRVFISALIFLFALNVINPDALIAKQNIERFNNTGRIDMAYLSELSDDAVPETSKLLDNKNGTLRVLAGHNYYLKKDQNIQATKYWQSYNLSRQKAHEVFEARKDLIKPTDNYLLLTQELNR